jgi:hypothetical protein
MNPFEKATERLVNDIDSSGTLIVRVLTKATSLTGFYAVLISSVWFPYSLLFFDSPILVHSPHDFYAASQSAEHFFSPHGNDSVVTTQDDDSFVSFSTHCFPMPGQREGFAFRDQLLSHILESDHLIGIYFQADDH